MPQSIWFKKRQSSLHPSILLRFSEDYEIIYSNNAAQAFIASLMSKLINSHAIGSQVDSPD